MPGAGFNEDIVSLEMGRRKKASTIPYFIGRDLRQPSRICWESFGKSLHAYQFSVSILCEKEILLMVIIMRSQYGIRRKGLLQALSDIRFYENHSFHKLLRPEWTEIYSLCRAHRTNQLSRSRSWCAPLFLYLLICISKTFNFQPKKWLPKMNIF